MFRRSHSFRRNALSNSVPLEGSDSVVGLRQLERQQRSSELNTFLERNLSELQKFGQTGYQRYKGPRLYELQWKDVKAAPVPWISAICGGSKTQWRQAYNVPDDTAMLQERMEENLVQYRGNYLWLAAAAALLATVLRPWSLLGILCMILLIYLNLDQDLDIRGINRMLDRATHGRPHVNVQGTNGEVHTPLWRSISTVALYLLIIYSRCIGMIPRCALASLGSVLLHASLRRAGSEYGFSYTAYVRAQKAGRHTNGDNGTTEARHALLAAQREETDRLVVTCRPGVRFSEVWHGVKNVGADARQRGPVEDPRRVFQELWGGIRHLVVFLAGCARHYAAYFYLDTRERLRMWRIPGQS